MHTELTNQQYPPPTREREPLSIGAFYQSKLFTVEQSVNNLVAAADPLITAVTKLRNSPQPNLGELYANLSHEVRAFENQAQRMDYRANVILAARYILCAWADELIVHNTPWGVSAGWENENLLHLFQGERWGGERFFLILQRACEDPSFYVDFIELIYLCLRLGFEGKYRHQPRGHVELGILSDSLFQLIRRGRGELKKTLLLSHQRDKNTTEKKHPLSLRSITTGTLLILAGIFALLHYNLNQIVTPLEHRIMQPVHWSATPPEKIESHIS